MLVVQNAVQLLKAVQVSYLTITLTITCVFTISYLLTTVTKV